MMHNDPKRIRLRIQGRVQGVGFRWFVIAEGRRLGIQGWVRNNVDGSVELEAAGSASELAELHQRVRLGPPAARVDSVTELPASSGALPPRFELKR